MWLGSRQLYKHRRIEIIIIIIIHTRIFASLTITFHLYGHDSARHCDIRNRMDTFCNSICISAPVKLGLFTPPVLALRFHMIWNGWIVHASLQLNALIRSRRGVSVCKSKCTRRRLQFIVYRHRTSLNQTSCLTVIHTEDKPPHIHLFSKDKSVTM